MRDFSISLAFFLLSVLVHILWSRWQRSKELKTLSFCVISLTGFVFSYYFLYLKPWALLSGEEITWWTIRLPFSSLVFNFLLIPAYLIFYFNINIDSPSKTIIVFAKRHKKATFTDLKKIITDERFVMTRVKDLLETDCVSFDGKAYRLTPRGVAAAKLLNIYEFLFGRTKGG